MIPKKISLGIIFILIYSIPSIIFVSLHQDSLATGMILACFIVLVYSFSSVYLLSFRAVNFVFFIAVSLILLVQSYYLFVTEDVTKPLYSVPALLLVIISSVLLSAKIEKLPSGDVTFAIRLATYFFLLCGWCSIILKIRFGPYELFDKPVIPFSEESHYALCVGFLGIISGYFSSGNHKKIIFFNLFGQAVLFPSLTLFIFSIMAIVIFWLTKNIAKLVVFSFILIGLFVIAMNVFSDSVAIQYFASRLNFSSDSSNMTTLVFLQGIDDAYRSLINTSGLGLGFQMAGTDQPGIYGYTIAHLSGSFLNRADGGFLASKLISEFGICGLTFVFFYILKLILGTKKLGQLSTQITAFESLYPLVYVLLVAFSVEFLLRGYGYFSPGVMMFITLYLMASKCERLK